MLKNLLAKLVHFTNRERVLFEKSVRYGKNYVQEEKFFIEAKFKTSSNKSNVIALSCNNTTSPVEHYSYTRSSTLTLTMNNQKSDMQNVYLTIFEKKRVDKVELRKFGIALLTLFGQFFTVKFCSDSENTRAIYDWSQMETHLQALGCGKQVQSNAVDFQ